MLPPMPSALVPVTAQQDTPKPLPDITPVTAVQACAHEGGVAMERRHPQDALEVLYAEQQKRRQRHQNQKNQEQPQSETEAEALEEYLETKGEFIHLGEWIDTQV